MASPMSLPPVTRLAIAPGRPFFSNTFAIKDVTAIEHNGVVGEGFHMVAFPAAKESARFLLGMIPSNPHQSEVN